MWYVGRIRRDSSRKWDGRKHIYFFDSWISIVSVHSTVYSTPWEHIPPSPRLKSFHIFHKLDVEFTPLILIGGWRVKRRRVNFRARNVMKRTFDEGRVSFHPSKEGKKGKEFQLLSFNIQLRGDSKSKLQSHFDEFYKSFFSRLRLWCILYLFPFFLVLY